MDKLIFNQFLLSLSTQVFIQVVWYSWLGDNPMLEKLTMLTGKGFCRMCAVSSFVLGVLKTRVKKHDARSCLLYSLVSLSFCATERDASGPCRPTSRFHGNGAYVLHVPRWLVREYDDFFDVSSNRAFPLYSHAAAELKQFGLATRYSRLYELLTLDIHRYVLCISIARQQVI
jgi:hypothetical protein